MPGGDRELAKETRRLQVERQELIARLQEQSVSLRAEAARDEKAKFARERDELTEYRKFYDDSLERLTKENRGLRAEIKKLTETASPSTQVAAGGAGRDAAGRDVDNSHNQIVFNIYGSEEWNPGKHPGMVKELASVVEGLVGSGRGREIVPRVLEAGIAKMGDAPGNRTLRGYSRCLDKVGVQVGAGCWEGRAPGKVAAEYAEKIGDAFEARGESMGRLRDNAQKGWADGPGGDEVVRLAVRNADRAGDTDLIFAAAGHRAGS
jgi:hypothetical protein